jgi:hypothetical protein
LSQFNFALTELDDMMPWEREIYVSLVEDHVKKRKREDKKTKWLKTI